MGAIFRPTGLEEIEKTDWDKKKEILAASLCQSFNFWLWPFEPPFALTDFFFGTLFGSCHGIKFICHYTAPSLVLLLSHYPSALVRMPACLSCHERKVIYSILCWTKFVHDQRAFDQIMPSDHPLALSSVHCKSNAQIMHKQAHTGTHTHTRHKLLSM